MLAGSRKDSSCEILPLRPQSKQNMVKDKILKSQERCVEKPVESVYNAELLLCVCVCVDVSASRLSYFLQVSSEPFVIDDPTSSHLTVGIIALLMHSIRLHTTRSGRCNQSIGNFYN